MKINDTQHELIDAYVQQKLKGNLLNSFERELAENEAIQQEVLFRQGLRSVFELKAVEEVIEQAKSDPLLEEANERKIENPQLESVHNTIQQAKAENAIRRKRTIRRLVALGIAASFLMFVPRITEIIFPKSLTEMADEYISKSKIELDYTVPEIEPVSATKDGIQALLSEATKAYKAEKFDQTRSIFDDLRSEYNYETDEMLLYEAKMDYNNSNYDSSIDLLQRIIERNSKIKDEAHWYLALVYLKTQKNDLAKEQLEILVKQSTIHQKDAQLLLNKLN